MKPKKHFKTAMLSSNYIGAKTIRQHISFDIVVKIGSISLMQDQYDRYSDSKDVRRQIQRLWRGAEECIKDEA